MMQLSPSLETSMECNENKDYWVFYSSEVSIETTRIAATYSGTKANNNTNNLLKGILGALDGRRYSSIEYLE